MTSIGKRKKLDIADAIVQMWERLANNSDRDSENISVQSKRIHNGQEEMS